MKNVGFLWERRQARWRQSGFSTVLGLAIWLGGGAWLLTAAIAPHAAHAYTSRVTLTLQREQNESYSTLVRRALVVARAAAQRSFDSDILITDVVVTIVGENRGLVAPVLALEVSRSDWRRRPDPQQWAIYFNTARELLEFEQAAPLSPSDPGDASLPPPPPAPTGEALPVVPLPEEVPGTPAIPQSQPLP